MMDDRQTDRLRRRLETAVIILFTGLVLVTAWRHEPWSDEAQAWLLVKDLGLWDLLAHYLRYEGHPSLWYLVLAVPVKLGLPYRWLPVIPALFAVAGTVVFVRCAPFPDPVRFLLPFGYFTLYQYGVIARSYAMLPLWLWLIAADYRNRVDHPWRYMTWLLLLAHTVLHGTIIAIVLALDRAREIVSGIDPGDIVDPARNMAPPVVFLLSLSLLYLQLKWPEDLVFTGGTVSRDPVLILALALTGIALGSLLVFAWSLAWMDRARVLFLYLVAMSGLLILTARVYKIWHEGIFFLLWVFILWLGWDRLRDAGMLDRWLRWAGMVALGAVVVIHGYWSWEALRYDWRSPYSGSRACACYLKDHGFSERDLFLVGYGGMSVLPYFDGNLFSNYNEGGFYRFWLWSSANPIVRIHLAQQGQQYLDWIRRRQPEWLLVSPDRALGPNACETIAARMPYRVVRTFPGEPRWKGILFESETLVLMRRTRQP